MRTLTLFAWNEGVNAWWVEIGVGMGSCRELQGDCALTGRAPPLKSP